MIRLVRPLPEPPALSLVRDGRPGQTGELARVRTIAATRAPNGDDVGTQYQVVREELWRQQAKKCAYCESLEQLKRNDVEHFRPKGRITDSEGRHPETPGYWWLAWSWSNLLFACRNCNQSPAKLDKFPLEPGSTRLAAEDVPPGGERFLLLDPYDSGVDPMDHVRFRREVVQGRPRWMPHAAGGSLRGQTSIQVYLLRRDDLVELYEHHVETWVLPAIAELSMADRSGNRDDVQAAWDRAIRLVDRNVPFAALAHDVLDQGVDPQLRSKWGLLLPRP